MRLPLGPVHLGRDDTHGDGAALAVGPAQALLAEHARDLLVLRGDAVLAVDREEDEVGAADGLGDLPLDVRGQVREVVPGVVVLGVLGRVDAEAAGINQLDGLVGLVAVGRGQLGDERDAVARHARRRIDDRDTVLRDHVEQRTLADVGPADDGDAGEGHG